MIGIHKESLPSDARPKAVGLISGGLDSILAAKVIKDLGVEVHGLYFSMPWGCGNKEKALAMAGNLGIQLEVIELGESFLEVVKKPKHGYGSALNPCVDCKIHMLIRARQHMENIGAAFVFTGEVLGQRPMSQLKQSLAIIEKESGLTGRLLRPLTAQVLEPTISEKEGLVDRSKLLSISGRSRKEQISLAEKYGIKDYLQPGGGCLLTDKNFARRMKDAFKHGHRDLNDVTSLKWGRHFRISENFKVILGRDEPENNILRQNAHAEDYIIEPVNKLGPTAVLKGKNPDPEVLRIAGGLVREFSKKHKTSNAEVDYWQVNHKDAVSRIKAASLTEEQIDGMRI
ncbi:MAG TPA: tRNA 4-thiouridine(8) synthase ThiI [Candidatus Omnitrophota bacterium]|nr:tRNA 4-thiouridine(8) synthase ThiI [Candidatus Omnitrophota bacterium]HRZ04089.1 tRNA 4-thiouridine(8) synthase ThiI [Candidatus Omnitrophota bacterium]